MMFEMQFGQKTQLGNYIGNHHKLSFGPLGNIPQSKTLRTNLQPCVNVVKHF